MDQWAVTVGERAPSAPAPAPAKPRTRVWLLAALLGLGVLALVALRTVGPRDNLDLREGPVVPTLRGGEYRFALVTPDGAPARWNPCEPIRYVVNPAGAPPSARADLAEAMAQVTRASGLRFADVGTTDETARTGRPPYQPERYGEEWAPVLISWGSLSAAGIDDAEGHGLGAAAATTIASGKSAVHVSGQMVFSTVRQRQPGFLGVAAQGSTMLHELGHLVGLSHVANSLDIMTADAAATLSSGRFGPGDLEGLAALGARGGCLRVPRASAVDVS